MAAERLKWTPELVNRFWDNVGQTRLTELSFAKLGGRSVITAIDHILPKHGRILDFGAGDGHLLRFMAQRGLTVAGYEPSKGRAANLQRVLENFDGFLGVVGDDSAETFDVVIMSEVIEHVLDEVLDATLDRLARFVRPGGMLVITTPNNEDLDLDMAYCPVSNLLFHRWQHVRSLDQSSLKTLLSRFGFDEVVTHQVGFDDNIFVPHDAFWSGKPIVDPLPDWLENIRQNKPSQAGAGNRLLYIGQKGRATDYGKQLTTFQTLAAQAMSKVPAAKSLPDRGGILMIIGSLGPGGAERQMVALVEQIVSRGVDSVAVALVHPPATERENFFRARLQKAGVRIIVGLSAAKSPAGSDKIPNPDPFEVLPSELADVRTYYDLLADVNPETVYLWMDEVCIKGGIAATVLQIPRILLCFRNMPSYHFPYYHGYHRDCYRFLAKQPSLQMLNNSQAGARAYAEWLELPEGAIKVVHNGIDLDNDAQTAVLRRQYRATLGIDEKTLIVGGVFRMMTEKRPFLWLDVAAMIREKMPNVRFLLVGNGARFDDVRARAEQLGLTGALTFTNLQLRPAAAIAAMDLFFLASRIEGFPNVILEAQALGVPVATTSAGGAPEAVLDGKTGQIFKPDATARVMADTIVDLLGNLRWRKKAAQLAPEHVKTSFSVKLMADGMLAARAGIAVRSAVDGEIVEAASPPAYPAAEKADEPQRSWALQWFTAKLPSWIYRS
ncbi:glycosyltransferase [Bradyrhizobium sp. 182]|uniref:methyltransferase domain-containing protein n=1 Tax=unclassified Bradyrhizobium TaxID=2631580 RepID=UPI001FF7D2AD|nr:MULTISPECIES: glycosyltransferase [unclassified Bradyrhizobium]MCK1422384.1 glycosyltransferase [Bradyrhizobium sp. CW12]MCK1527897.1 glycosyltransferase [Bradyrhizobium sp. 182]MCK1649070.1 glycosyltransferase [Bradyrhizobium sp. 154]